MGKAGNLLWHRMRVTITSGLPVDVDTLLSQVTQIFDAPNEPPMGVVEAGATPPLSGTLPPSRIMVIPLAPTANWGTITHSEPYLDTATGTIHVAFANSGEVSEEINVLFWDPHSLIGPGLADTYNVSVGDLIAGLESIENFAVLAGSTITSTGDTALTGDLGLSPGSSVTGFPPGTVSGTQHVDDATAVQAKATAQAAYTAFQGLFGAVDLTGQDLGGLTLPPGVYKFDTSAQLTGILTLDGRGDPTASWVFQIGSTLTTASGSSVVMINSGNPENVVFAVGSSATLGTTTSFIGAIIAQASITMNTEANIVDGHAFALVGAVTFDQNDVVA